MKKTKQKFLMTGSFLTLASAFFLMFAVVGHLQTLQINTDQIRTEELCSFVTPELKFCTDRQKIILTPEESLVLNFSFLNTSGQEMAVNTSDRGNYIFNVTDANGEKIRTRLEQKMNNSPILDDGEGSIFNVTGNMRWATLKPSVVQNVKIPLNTVYDFSKVGTYHIEVIKNTKNPNGGGFIKNRLGQIEIEVKNETK